MEIDQVHCITFVLTTKNAIVASNHLSENVDFQYVLPAVFSMNPPEKYFGQSIQRVGGNYYIDVIAVAKLQRLHILVKNDIIPDKRKICVHCGVDINEEDLLVVAEFSIDDIQELLNLMYTLVHKVVYIAAFISRKHK